MSLLRFTAGVFVSFTILFLLNQPVVAQYVCQPSGAPVVINGTIDGTDLTQNGRINRNGIASSCAGKTNALFAATVLRRDAHNFTNPTGQPACVTVDVDHTGCAGNTTQVVAYSVYDPLNPGNNVIGDFGFSTVGVARFGFPIAAGANFTIVVHEIGAGTGCPNYQFTVSYKTGCRQPGFDVSNDKKADPTYFRPSTGDWSTMNSAGGTVDRNFGVNGDIVTGGDYTGDGQSDVSVYRNSDNTWYWGNNNTNPGMNFSARQWGTAGDVPVPGDYDGDGKADVAIWRPSEGNWYILNSSATTLSVYRWGRNGDTPAPADYDGDLKTDPAIVRPDEAGFGGNYNWYLLTTNFNFGFPLVVRWGITGDKPVPADYDGNGKADLGVFRPSSGQWFIIPSIANNAVSLNQINFKWGLTGDIPQPADYDGDDIADFAVFRPSDASWYILNSGTGMFDIKNFGTATDQPATAPYRVTP